MPNDIRLIDANALLENRYRAGQFHPDMWVVTRGFIENAPTIDPVRTETCEGCYYLKNYGSKPCGSCRRNPDLTDHYDKGEGGKAE